MLSAKELNNTIWHKLNLLKIVFIYFMLLLVPHCEEGCFCLTNVDLGFLKVYWRLRYYNVTVEEETLSPIIAIRMDYGKDGNELWKFRVDKS